MKIAQITWLEVFALKFMHVKNVIGLLFMAIAAELVATQIQVVKINLCRCNDEGAQQMSENNGLASWQRAIEYMNSYEPTDKLSEALQRIKELEIQLEQAKKDQARYLHLRDKTLINNEINDSLYVAIDSVHFPDSWAVVGSELDRAVDMAIAAMQEGK